MTYMLYYYAASYVILHSKRKIFCVHGLLKEIRHTKIKLSAQAKLTKSADLEDFQLHLHVYCNTKDIIVFHFSIGSDYIVCSAFHP